MAQSQETLRSGTETLRSGVNWTDDQTVELKIIYSSGKIKTISDYGASGSYGLKKVYKLLFDLRQNQNWKKIDEK